VPPAGIVGNPPDPELLPEPLVRKLPYAFAPMLKRRPMPALLGLPETPPCISLSSMIALSSPCSLILACLALPPSPIRLMPAASKILLDLPTVPLQPAEGALPPAPERPSVVIDSRRVCGP